MGYVMLYMRLHTMLKPIETIKVRYYSYDFTTSLFGNHVFVQISPKKTGVDPVIPCDFDVSTDVCPVSSRLCTNSV